ncbi:putative holliday junction resolvase [Seinonella peptonophila]|uniref:Putative pre-16S rRNA nuclease n=1 Tax=Seinonella peptonophila TaxID=112248 RepID=A0A1M4W9P5_9BACL|nr:Holliday junction resolvase RuvX [Seinonella peptonophila]SHE77956.1 putative holliday junction resolvase [Seinonella peptonophila]
MELQRVICLDLGEKRTGVAISDELGWTAQGLQVIKGYSDEKWLLELDRLVSVYQATTFVVGLPRNMDGSIGEAGNRAKQIAQKIEQRYHLPVHLWDERLSTAAVERTLLEADTSRKGRKKVIDKMAASWVLQGFLDAQRRQ